MRKIALFLLAPFSISVIGCVPFKANKPIQVSQVNYQTPKPPDLSTWRAKQLQKIAEMKKQMEEETKLEWERNNPILDDNPF